MLDHLAEWASVGRSGRPVSGSLPASSGERLFVGRDAELANLIDNLQAVLSGEGRSVLITGDAGIGKTRLASEFSLRVRARGAVVLWGRCWEAGGAPSYWPWIEALRQMLTSEHLPSQLVLGPYVTYLSELVPELSDHLTSGRTGGPPAPKDPESARFLMFDVIGRFLRAVATNAPIVVVLDDLHVADRASLLLLAFLARTLHDSRVLLVGTYRNPDAFLNTEVAQPLADIGRQASQLPLFGLSSTAVGHLIQHSAGRVPSDSLVQQIHRITEGNPLFVDEIVRLLGSEVRYGLTAETYALLRIPDGVREAVRRRLEQMSPEATAVLEAAAVIGREFDVTAVYLACEKSHLDVLDAFERPIRQGLILEVDSNVGRFQFRHALIREVIYDSLPFSRRILLHRKVGEAFERLSDSRPDRYITELAHHFLASAPCGGADVRFIEYANRAARRAINRMAFEEAVIVHQRTLDALPFAPPDERRKCKILLSLGEAKEWANDAAGSRETFELAASIARRLGASDLLVEAALGIGAIQALKFTATSRCESAPELLREALNVIDPDDRRSRARINGRLALASLSAGDRPDALRLSAIGESVARSCSDPVTIGLAITARHAVLYGPDNLEERMRIASELVDLGRKLGSREFAMRGHALRFTISFEIGDIRGADAALAAHGQLAAEAADPFERWANLVWRGARVLMEGQFTQATDYANEAFALAREVPGLHATDLYGPVTFAGQRILIEETRGGSLPDSAVAEHFQSRFPEISAWRVAFLSGLTRDGQIEAVRQELDALARGGFEDFERNGTWLASMTYLSEAIELIADRDRAEVLYRLLTPFHDRNATVSHIASRGSVSRYLGLLAHTLDRWDDAELHFQSAINLNRRMSAHPHVVHTLFDYSRVYALREGPRCSRAMELAEEALSEADRIGMTGLTDRCKMLLGQMQSSAVSKALPLDQVAISLRRAKDVWILEHAGQQLYLKNAKGLAYIALLIAQPNREVHATELAAALTPDDGTRGSGRLAQENSLLGRHSHRDCDAVIDSRARRAYVRRVEELSQALARAEECGDPETAVSLREELTTLRRELKRAVGLGGRARTNSDSERARIRVTRAIRLALGHIAASDQVIAERMYRCIRTGTFCCYEPE